MTGGGRGGLELCRQAGLLCCWVGGARPLQLGVSTAAGPRGLTPCCYLPAALCGFIGGNKFTWNGVQSSNPAAVSWDLLCTLHELG